MKILIVEDDADKLRNIVATLLEINDILIDDITNVTDARRAKQHLYERNYDLIVLDLHLPDRLDLPPQTGGGLDFVRSISSRPSFFVPPHVVAISGNHEALAMSSEDVGELWGVIRYDATSNQWRDQLKSRVKYAMAAWRSALGRPRETRACDIAILTALDDELGGILRLPLDWKEFRVEGDATTYHEAACSTKSGQLTVVAATAGRMGMAATASLASKVIDFYRPRYICMTGVTGGIRGRVALGDLLVPDPSWDWGSGKYEVVDGKPNFAANPEQLRLDPDIRALLKAASADKASLSKIQASFPGTAPDNILKCHVEAVASGASVLGDAAVVEAIKLQNRKLHGVEMEVYGLMMAAETCARPRPVAFAAKAVSDFADPTKGDDVRSYAIHVSSHFVHDFIVNRLPST